MTKDEKITILIKAIQDIKLNYSTPFFCEIIPCIYAIDTNDGISKLRLIEALKLCGGKTSFEPILVNMVHHIWDHFILQIIIIILLIMIGRFKLPRKQLS